MDYESASTRDRERIDLLVTTNSRGKQGCCIPTDMCCEHKVRSVKDLLKSFNNQLETTLITKSVLARNSEIIIKDHWLDSMGKGDLKSGGGHRHQHMKTEERELVRNELKRLKLFQGEKARDNVIYHQKIRRVWADLKDESIDVFLERNMLNYKRKKTYRFNY